ncbi:MAG: efflux RND transporter permease subunit [Alphaproteobacteria bacterium]|nr:efflux RND transporter permease subunit [Alphaproteobacteria bacterium]
MWLSDTSVKRPVFATVLNLLIIVFGIMAYTKLPLREYPDIDPPIVSIDTSYRGASANVIETRITELIEERIAGVEGIKSISSSSEDGRSRITVEFDISRNIDDAANDVRDRVSGVLDDIPDEADPPDVRKADADSDVIMWMNLVGEGMSIMDLTDYAQRYLEDRFSALDGVAQVRIGGAQERAMRIWLDRNALAARNLTVADVENALRTENVELPAGSIESTTRDFTVRIQRSFEKPEDFQQLVLTEGADGYLVRLGDVARVEVGAVEERSTLRGNGLPMVGVGIIKQSKANTLDVAKLAKEEMANINETLPPGMEMRQSYDSSVFIESSVHEVYITLGIAIILVIGVIYAFLGSMRATLVPAAAVPVSLIGTFVLLFALGFTVNLLTLLAIILAIGLVVDDAIVVLENIHRRIEAGEPPLLAAYRGVRQVGFAVVATTAVLVAVFVPITFLEGDIGRLFTEFAVTMAGSVIISAVVALSFCPMLSSKVLKSHEESTGFSQKVDRLMERVKETYLSLLGKCLDHAWLSVGFIVIMSIVAGLLMVMLPKEFTPQEDRGAFFVNLKGPEGSSYEYMMEHVNMVEQRLMPFADSGEFQRLLMRAPGSFGTTATYNDARGTVVLADWGSRKPIEEYLAEVRARTADVTGVKVSTVMRQAFGSGSGKPMQFVIGGPTYEELVQWRDTLLAKMTENPNLLAVDYDYQETKPQIGIEVNRDYSETLGVPVSTINATLESMLGSRQVTTYIDNGEEYDVLVESEKDLKRSPTDITNLYVRSERTNQLIPLSNLVSLEEFSDAATLRRYNRLRSITIEANLAPGYSLGTALEYMENLVKEELPSGVVVNYKGDSQDLKESGNSIYLIFALALIVVFLVMAAQFESFIHPLIIMLTVPLAITGALFALWITGQSLNIYSQIGLIILVGLATKNGILIVEFINQLRDEGMEFREAILDASAKRLRPIIMTVLATAMGAVPLMITGGAGAETRMVIGIVIFAGVLIATMFTLFIVPAIYQLMAKNTGSPEAINRKLEALLHQHEEKA